MLPVLFALWEGNCAPNTFGFGMLIDFLSHNESTSAGAMSVLPTPTFLGWALCESDREDADGQ